jgi:hypothetical protein
MLREVSEGWESKERHELVIAVLEDCVDSIKAAAKLVAAASEGFDWKKKKRRKLMQAVVECDAFKSLFGKTEDIFKARAVNESNPASEHQHTVTAGDAGPQWKIGASREHRGCGFI